MTELPDVQSQPPNHQVFLSIGARYAMRCPAWGLTWYYPDQETAEYFLHAHLAYPVAPCTGADHGEQKPMMITPGGSPPGTYTQSNPEGQ